MPSYADVLCGRILLRDASVPSSALFTALNDVKAALGRGAEISLLEALEKRNAVSKDVLERTRQAQARAQHLEAEKAFARLVVEEGLAPPESVRALVEESRASGFREGLGPLMVRRGTLNEAQAGRLFDRRQVALAEARARRERAFASALSTLGQRFSEEEDRRLRGIFEVDTLAPGAPPPPTRSFELGSAAGPMKPQPPAPPPLAPSPRATTKPKPQPELAKTTVGGGTGDGIANEKTQPAAKIEPQDKAFALASASQPADPQKPLSAEDCPIYGYEIVKELGKGAMGVVYKARHIFTDRLVALKILPLKLARDSAYLERFKREAIAAMRLQHDNVVRAYDFGGSEEYYYLALEFVEGETLEKRLDREGRLPERVALEFVRQVARALDEASRLGIVHRDVKPENIMITKEGVAKLCDFGIVKLKDHQEGSVTVAGTTVGTPFYIAPEQARGEEDLDTRTDLYALGITLFHLVTGKVPFTGKSQGAILVRHILEEVPDPRSFEPAVSEACAAIVRRCTRKKREDRYPTPAELVLEIEKALAEMGAPA